MSDAMDVDPEIQCFDCADQEEEPEDEEYFQFAHGLAKGFEELVADVGKARDARRERMAFKSAAEMADEMVSSDRVALNDDERQQLGEWLPGDEYQGDVNMRTLDRLLKRVDQRGFERSAQQLEFHQAFMRACGRVLYREDWATRKPEIMAKHGWERCNSESNIVHPYGALLIIGGRKTFSIAIFCACMALTFGHEIVVFSPARRASRKLLERIVEFVRLAGGDAKICEYNQARGAPPRRRDGATAPTLGRLGRAGSMPPRRL